MSEEKIVLHLDGLYRSVRRGRIDVEAAVERASPPLEWEVHHFLAALREYSGAGGLQELGIWRNVSLFDDEFLLLSSGLNVVYDAQFFHISRKVQQLFSVSFTYFIPRLISDSHRTFLDKKGPNCLLTLNLQWLLRRRWALTLQFDYGGLDYLL